MVFQRVKSRNSCARQSTSRRSCARISVAEILMERVTTVCCFLFIFVFFFCHFSYSFFREGLFQVNSRYWCSGGPRSPARGDCGISCSQALDCARNVRCAKIVYDRQGLNAWYGYRSFKRECDSYALPASCRAPGGSSQVDMLPDSDTVDSDMPPSLPPSNVACSYRQANGNCQLTTTCSRAGGSAYASRLGAQGCESIPSASIQCCIATSSMPPAPSCTYAGNLGLCTANCASPKILVASNSVKIREFFILLILL